MNNGRLCLRLFFHHLLYSAISSFTRETQMIEYNIHINQMFIVPLPKDAHQTKTYEITASMDISMVTSSTTSSL